MKKYGFLIAACTMLLGGTWARAEQTMTCFSDDVRYQLTVDFGHKPVTALVAHDGTPAMFGDLRCEENESSDALACHSHGVADAGFNAIITAGGKGHVARLGEIWIGGERPLGLMTCDW